MVFRLIPEMEFPWTMAFLILDLLIITNLITNLTVKSSLSHISKSFTIMEYITLSKELPFTLLFLSMTVFSFSLFLPFNYLILQALAEGTSTHLLEYMISTFERLKVSFIELLENKFTGEVMLIASSIFGRILPGIVADRLGRFNVMTITVACSGVVVLALWIPKRANIPIVIFAILFGVFSGGYVSLGPTLIAQIFRNQPNWVEE